MNIIIAAALSLLSLVAVSPSALAADAMLQSVLGQVSVKISAEAAAVRGRAGMNLPQGAEVTTGPNARAIIRFSATDVVRLAPQSTLQVAALNQGTAANGFTVLRLVSGSVRAMLTRIGAKRRMNFAIAAGAAVCAVKGTEWDLYYPGGGAAPEVVCSSGAVSVGTAKPDLASVLASIQAQIGGTGTLVPAGYHVRIDSAGNISRPVPAPVRTTLTVVSINGGKVMATVGGVTTEIHPGEDVPADASIQVVGGEAVFQGAGQAVSAGDGANFTYSANPTQSGGLTSSITPAAGSTPVQLEVGGTIATVDAGSSVQVVQSGGSAPSLSASGGNVTVTNAAGGIATLQPGESVSTAVATTDVNGQVAVSDDAATLSTINVVTTTPPALPPDTTNQTYYVISPSGP